MRRSALRHIRRETGRSDCIRMQKNASGPGQHVQQANGAKQMFNADFAVLVTSGRTKRFGGFDDMHGVLVISPLGVVALQACCESI